MVMVHLLLLSLLSTLLYGLAVGTDWQGQCVRCPGTGTGHLLEDTNTPSQCITKCTGDGQPYAGLHYGVLCYCFSAETIQDTQAVAPGKCALPCPGDHALTCGGSGDYCNLYRTFKLIVPAPATTTVTTTTKTATTTTRTITTTATTPDPPTDPESTTTSSVLFMTILFSCLMVPFTLVVLVVWCMRRKEAYDQARAPKVETNDTYGNDEEEDTAEVEDANVYYGEGIYHPG